MKKIAVLISNKGTGTNLQAIIDAAENKKINAKVIAVISDTNDAPGLVRAKKHKIKTVVCGKKEDLLPILLKLTPDYVALAGWKQIVTDEVIAAFKNRILNVHPGLIPDAVNGTVINPDGTLGLWNKGKLAEKAIGNFLEEKATYAGSSIHFLTDEFDFGPVLGRVFEKIKKGDTVELLYNRLKKKEHKIYVEALKKLSLATVLVIDGGGRGHALLDKYSQSPKVGRVLVAPGKDLMLETNPRADRIFPSVKTTDKSGILNIVEENKVDLIDVAQDDAVAAGIADLFSRKGYSVFGPSRLAGQIEWDKTWSRDFMKKFKIPIPNYKIFTSQREGTEYLRRTKNSEWYVKAAGLTLGKGVYFAKDNKDAAKKIELMKKYGKSGKKYLLEQRLIGEEFSSYAVLDGKNFKVLGHAQDHKTIFENNKGPNTGGIGSTSTPLCITKDVEKQITSIFRKTAEGLSSIKRPYLGILYLGGMIDRKGKVFVIEFNARWGDPEAEVIVPSIKNDLYELAMETSKGNLKSLKITRDNLYRIVVTATAKGYPTDHSKALGKKIFGLDKLLKSKLVKIFGAGVKKSGRNYLVDGGRLFHVVADGKNVHEARRKVYSAISKIRLEENYLHYRRDIGYRDVERMRGTKK